MPTSCTSPHRYGTHASRWLNGAHPEEHEGKETRHVCFHWSPNYCNVARCHGSLLVGEGCGSRVYVVGRGCR